jgi:hypothetical protein
MPVIDRLVFLGLICMADDAGRLVDNIKSIDGFIFPASEDTSRESLMRLSGASRITRYTSASGQALIQIANWKKHQKIGHPSKYTLPAPVLRPSRDPHEDRKKVSRLDLGPTTKDLLPTTKDQKADKDLEQVRAPAPPPKPAAAPLADALAEMPQDAIAFLQRFYPKGIATRERRADVARQIVNTLTCGTPLRRGAIVFAHSVDRLAAKCRAVMQESIEDRDKAIVVLLLKLNDTSDLTEGAARAAAVARAEDERETAAEITAAESWLEEHALIASSIDAELAAQGYAADADGFVATARNFARIGLVLTAWRSAGAPGLVAAHFATAPPDPDAALAGG